MTETPYNRFQDFFEDGTYIALKNYLYNYLLRKRAVEKAMRAEAKELVLEVGSGISPVLTSWDRMVYSDASASAMEELKKMQGKGQYIVADATKLPFADGSFSHVIASEVLEHIPDDRRALAEISRVLKPEGALIVTIPHRQFYFAHDDRYVEHYRRYELKDLTALLAEAGMEPVDVRKVLGPLEKITMCGVTLYASLLEKRHQNKPAGEKRKTLSRFAIHTFKWFNRFYAAAVWLDAQIIPRPLSTVLLVKAKKKSSPSS